MIGIIFKCTIAFVLSFIVLSFQVNHKSVFAHLSEVLGPLGSDVQHSLQKSFKRGVSKSSDLSKEFFDNSEPKFTDQIKSQRSSMNLSEEDIILEKLEQEDIKELDKVINDNK